MADAYGQNARAGGDDLPFWFSSDLSSTTILYAAVLTLLAALIVGVAPAIKVTRGIGSRIQQASAGTVRRLRVQPTEALRAEG